MHGQSSILNKVLSCNAAKSTDPRSFTLGQATYPTPESKLSKCVSLRVNQGESNENQQEEYNKKEIQTHLLIGGALAGLRVGGALVS
jgi:hypothetical protein